MNIDRIFSLISFPPPPPPHLLSFQMVEVKMKRLERTPSSLPLPNPNAILCNLSWLSGLGPEVLDTIHSYAKLMQFEHGDVMIQQGDSARGIYIIVSGLVKVRLRHMTR